MSLQETTAPIHKYRYLIKLLFAKTTMIPAKMPLLLAKAMCVPNSPSGTIRTRNLSKNIPKLWQFWGSGCGLSWQSGRFKYQRPAVRIQSSAKIYKLNIYFLSTVLKIKKKRSGMAHFFKKNFGNSKYEKFVNQTTFWVSNQNDLAIFSERIWSH